MNHFTIFTAFEFQPIGEGISDALQYFDCAFAHATLNLTREDFDQFESIIKPIFANFDRMRVMHLRNGKPLDTAFTTAENFLEKRAD